MWSKTPQLDEARAPLTVMRIATSPTRIRDWYHIIRPEYGNPRNFTLACYKVATIVSSFKSGYEPMNPSLHLTSSVTMIYLSEWIFAQEALSWTLYIPGSLLHSRSLLTTEKWSHGCVRRYIFRSVRGWKNEQSSGC